MHLVGNIHLIAGSPEVIPDVLALLQGEGIAVANNPDVYVRTYLQFGIDEARSLRERASSRAIQNDRRIFIVATPSMTNEAQNALLKTLEEPPADALFFFILPAPEALLPTLRSRAQVLRIGKDRAQEGIADAKIFFAADAQKRLEMLSPLLEKDEGDPSGLGAGKRDLGAILVFLSSLERTLAGGTLQNGVAEGLEAIYRARRYVTDKGALVKPLLEQVALLVPRV